MSVLEENQRSGVWRIFWTT